MIFYLEMDIVFRGTFPHTQASTRAW